MSKLDVLAEEILIKVDGKRVLCKAVLLSDKGGHVVSYIANGAEVKSQPLYRSPFKDKVKEIKALKAEQVETKQEQPLSEQVETLKKVCETAGLSQQQLAEKYAIPLETLTAWFNNAPPPEDYVVNLLLRCLAIDFPTTTTISEPVLSEQEPVIEQPAEPTYIFTDEYGKPLSAKIEKLVRVEYETGKVEPQPEKQEHNFYGDLVNTGSKGKGKLYQCTDIDPESELSFAFMFRVMKEV